MTPTLSPVDLLRASREAPTAALSRAARADGPTAARQAAEDFEAYYLFTTLQQMGKSTGLADGVDQNSLQTFQMFLHQHVAQAVAKAGGIGLADHVTAALLQHQEVQP